MVALNEKIKNSILGAVVGDAMGVPYEFMPKNKIRFKDEMIEDKRRYLPSGTWSDDSSMIFCTMESIIKNGQDIKSVGNEVIKWYDEGYWTPYGRVFDIGGTTSESIESMKNGIYINGLGEENSGNGSLMRILPCAIYSKDWSTLDGRAYIQSASQLTHGNYKCSFSCLLYSDIIRELLSNRDIDVAFENAVHKIKWHTPECILEEFKDLLDINHYKSLSFDDLSGSGYVIKTLETSIWIMLHAKSYYEAIEMSIKVGGDTDTIACIVGGAMGLYYQNIPMSWIDEIARKNDVLDLIDRFIEVI